MTRHFTPANQSSESAQPAALQSTLSSQQACQQNWDVLVIGSGLAGAIAARQLAMGGAKVLLVEKSTLPRRKVCGCYLNQSGLGTLASVGLGDIADRLRSPKVSAIKIGAGGRHATIPLPTGAALSRDALDTVLAQAAIDAGAAFLSGVSAKVGGVSQQQPGRRWGRRFFLRSGTGFLEGFCGAIVVADGIGGQSLSGCDDIQFKTAKHSLIGVSAMCEPLPSDYQPGTIHMAVGPDGYVGALQLQNGWLDVAAAFQPGALRRSSPGELAGRTIGQSGLPVPRGLGHARWLGTPPLTKYATEPAAERLFLIGDSAGYVEPFTGEGMAWALSSGRSVAPLVLKLVLENASGHATEMPARWVQQQRRLLGRRKRFCRMLTLALRHPLLVRAGVGLLGKMPWLAKPVVKQMNQVLRPAGWQDRSLHTGLVILLPLSDRKRQSPNHGKVDKDHRDGGHD